MTLPYDISRCAGNGDKLCQTCQRTESVHPEMQWIILPVASDGECVNHIPTAADEMERMK